ncbi:MAG: DUF4097 family beta strand repeat protein [Clostridia bacterium]|nr:DUF4097 family beta strand repeat protein [Clostridia bacterium]
MTTFQKIIKYLAILFAFCLIGSIAAGVISGVTTLAKLTDLTTSDGKIEDVQHEEIKKIRIKLLRTNLIIKAGNEVNAETDNGDITVKKVFGTLVVEENTKSIIDSLEKTELVLTIPEDCMFEEIKITTGAGAFNAELLNAEKIDLNFGAGNVGIDKMLSTERTEITGGAGKIEIRDGKTHNLNFDMGMGKLHYRAEITGRSELNCGVGAVEMILLGGEENYDLDIDKGLGLASINGISYADEVDYGDGENKLDINGGVGELKVIFE